MTNESRAPFRKIGLWQLITASILLMGADVLLQGQALSKAPGAEVFSLTPDPGPFTEPAIAVNPQNPQQVLAVFQDNAHASYSPDAGHTWQVPAQDVAPPNYKISGDVSTAYDNQGHAFICYIAFDKLGTFNYWGHNASRNGVFVRRSLDGGKTWEAKHVPVAEHREFRLKISRISCRIPARAVTREISMWDGRAGR